MKQLSVLLLAFLLFLSCVKDGTEQRKERNHRHYDKIYCEFMSIDAFNPEIQVVNRYNGTRTSFILRFKLKGNDNDFINKYRVNDELTSVKEKNLADTLSGYRFHYDTGVDTYLKVIDGGISGPVKVFADEEIDGRPAGKDLSDMFWVHTRGIVKYPDMTLVIDGHQSKVREAEYYMLGFKEYFSEGAVPFAVDYDTYLDVQEGYSYLFDGSTTIHFEIPIIGIASDGQEKSMVLKGTIPPAD